MRLTEGLINERGFKENPTFSAGSEKNRIVSRPLVKRGISWLMVTKFQTKVAVEKTNLRL